MAGGGMEGHRRKGVGKATRSLVGEEEFITLDE